MENQQSIGIRANQVTVKEMCSDMEEKIEKKIEDRLEQRREKKEARVKEQAQALQAADIQVQTHVQSRSTKWILNGCTAAGLVLMGLFVWYCWKQGIFQSQEALEDFLVRFGIWAPVIFTVVQAVQVVLPILPGAVGCLAGVLIFGPVWGFVFNYIGISIGSICAFLLARRYGAPFVRNITSPKLYDKYIGWLEKGNRFDKFFAIAIFFPVAPDDFLCYLAGLTRMRLRKMATIILLGKPFSIALYSLGLYTIGMKLLSLIK